jgi:hypothetical protein
VSVISAPTSLACQLISTGIVDILFLHSADRYATANRPVDYASFRGPVDRRYRNIALATSVVAMLLSFCVLSVFDVTIHGCFLLHYLVAETYSGY